MESVTTYLFEVLRITFLWILFFSDASINNILSNIAGVIEDYFLLIFGERESKQTIDNDFNRRTPRFQHSNDSEDQEEDKEDKKKKLTSSRLFRTRVQLQSVSVGPLFEYILRGGPSKNILNTPTDNGGRQVRGQQQPVVYAPLPPPPRPPTA